MPDPSSEDISNDNTSLAMASEGEIWNNLSLESRANILGQDMAGEAENISNNKESVYQKDLKNSSYENMSYYSLPPAIQFYVSNKLHEVGYFRDTYGANVYEVEGESRYKCKDCDDIFTAEEDFRVHRKVSHDSDESETESQEAYFRSLDIDPNLTKDNLSWARKVLRGESARQTFPQEKGPTITTPKLPKGRKEYDDNPNHYFYDNKLFKKGTRSPYESGLTEARLLIEVEEEILNKYGWESTKDVEKSQANREIYATEVAQKVTASELHPRTLKILDSVNKPLLFKTLIRLGAVETQPEEWDEQVIKEEPMHQDYDPQHPHEHNDFDKYFGDKVAEEDDKSDLEKIFDKAPMLNDEEDHIKEEHAPLADMILQESDGRTCQDCGFHSNDETQMNSHKQEHLAGEDFPFEKKEEETSITAEPSLLEGVDASVIEVEAEEYNIDEKNDIKASEARTLSSYVGNKTKGGESLADIMDGALDVPVATETVNEVIYNRKLDGYHEDKIARELFINHGLEYNDAIKQIRGVEVSDDDRVAKTLFGKLLSECNQAEITEMRTYAGEAKKNTTGVNYD